MKNLPAKAFKAAGGGTLLLCRVQPGASRSGVAGAYGGESVRIALQSPPVDGRANQELLRMLAELCGIPKGRVSLRSGASGRTKSVFIEGVSPEELRNVLSEDI